MNYKKLAVISIIFLVFISLAANYAIKDFYARYEKIEKHLENSLSYNDSTANAIKHAAAASDMFTTLRMVIGTKAAETTVIALGLMNEYIEQFIYPNDQDSAREIMKDLHNNYVGIEAAKLADTADIPDTHKIILSLADNRTLIVNRSYNPFFDEKEPKKDIVEFGYNWFDEHRNEIDARIQMKLRRIIETQSASQISLSSLTKKSTAVE